MTRIEILNSSILSINIYKHLFCAKNIIPDPWDTTKDKMNLVSAFMALAYILLKADR